MPSHHSVAIYLSPNSLDCRVLLDGRDISDACQGVELHAHVGDGWTRVVLHLIAAVEIIGEAGSIEIRKPGDLLPGGIDLTDLRPPSTP
jgi:hypothetical protein